ncbi:MAG: VTT domain-containing protein [Deltaproteobacteria bacterium]|nr:VTT domain-containing protein [Deltaproteobacteria bacterium]
MREALDGTLSHDQPPADRPLLRPGQTVWRLARATRAAFLVDGRAYFRRLVQACLAAQRTVSILGWDVNSQVELWRDPDHPGVPTQVGPFLNHLAARGLEIRVLAWDFAMIYAMEREVLPVYRLGWRSHRRVHFRLDGRHPLGASQHQKVVVVDDRLAFAGGLDLAENRWDTPGHGPDLPGRVNTGGVAYQPFHDVQMAVEGPAAAALGDLFRERWQRAGGRRLAPPHPSREAPSPWPGDLEPDLREVEVGIARTLPAHEGRAEVREVEALYRESIAAARRWIYLENQYFTSHAVGEALAARLAGPAGPEVILVLPRGAVGWLEESTMQNLRHKLLEKLRQADRHGRLKVYYPHREDLAEGFINVHAKVMVVDERLARVGSANASNRSMGLDSECDLAVEAANPEQAAGVRGLLLRLLGEHLGVDPARLARVLERRGSLAGTIEEFRPGTNPAGKTLRPLEEAPPLWAELDLVDEAILDPEKPLSPERLASGFLSREDGAGWGLRFLGLAGLALAAAALALAWRYGPLGEWLTSGQLAAWITGGEASPWAPLAVVAAFGLGGLFLVPASLLTLAVGLVFPFGWAVLLALAGLMVSALGSYALGRRLGRDRVRALGGSGLNRLSRGLTRHGVLALALLRNLPWAPFTIVNLVAGAARVKPGEFALGTLLGLLPGTVGLTLLGRLLRSLVGAPTPWKVGLALAGAAALFLVWSLAKRWWLRRANHA